MEDQEYARKSWDHVKAERQRVSCELAQMGWKILPSQANFIFATTPDGNGQAAYLGLKEQGILVRHFDKPGLADKIRITIGTSQENNAAPRRASNRCPPPAKPPSICPRTDNRFGSTGVPPVSESPPACNTL